MSLDVGGDAVRSMAEPGLAVLMPGLDGGKGVAYGGIVRVSMSGLAASIYPCSSGSAGALRILLVV
jgi:hypothetical protein